MESNTFAAMEAIIIAGIIQSVFLALLLFNKKKKTTADLVLGSWLLFIGLHLLSLWFHYSEIQFKYPHLLGLGTFFPMLQGPFLFVYTSVVISKSGRFKRNYLWHGLPFALISIYGLFDFYLLNASDKLEYYRQLEIAPNIWYSIAFIFVVYNGPIYVLLSLFRFRKHRKNISDNFSYTEEISLSWLKYVLIGMGLIWLTVMGTELFDFISLEECKGDYVITSTIVFVVFFMGYFGFKQHSIYTDISLESARNAMQQHAQQKQQEPLHVDSFKVQAEKLKRTKKADKEKDIFLERLLDFMEKEKPYLDSKLSLGQLAEMIELSNNHLSEMIKTRLGKNFFDFINEYRIKEVKEKLADPNNKSFTLLAIAYDCGFNSKSSFNSLFKKYTGLTPSEYQRSV